MRLLSHVRPGTLHALAVSSRSFTSFTSLLSPEQVLYDSFAPIVDQYDAFILDQFGVLHNGVSSLEGAVECVEYLYSKQKKLIILSNTSAPAHKALEKLPKLGFDATHFVGAVTSGEEASHYIRRTYGSNSDTAKKALFITWDLHKEKNARLTAPPQAFLDQCGNVKVATSMEDADFVLLHGSEIWYRGESKEEATWLGAFIEEGCWKVIDPILSQCLDRELPLVCANPDNIVQTPTGGTAHMPGKIATRYQELGGDVTMFGKPGVEHFEACISKLGLEKHRVCHVGDSLHHDIAGANRASIPNCFVTSGIHARDLKTSFGELPERTILSDLLGDQDVLMPTHVVPAFRM